MEQDFTLHWSGSPVIKLGPITGHTELAPWDSGVASAIALVDAVIADPEGGPADPSGVPSPAARLASADRDRILGQVYLRLYGRSVHTTLTCGACTSLFDLDIDLPLFIEHCAPAVSPDGPEAATDRTWNGIEVRPPTGVDELAALAQPHPAEALLTIVTDGAASTPEDRAEVAAILERTAPMLSSPIGATCPECGFDQALTFDLQRYLLGRITMDRSSVLSDVHLLASTYHWARRDILDLDRHERRAYAALVADSLPARRPHLVR